MIILDMPMPKKCAECPMWDNGCKIIHSYGTRYDEKRLRKCPIVGEIVPTESLRERRKYDRNNCNN